MQIAEGRRQGMSGSPCCEPAAQTCPDVHSLAGVPKAHKRHLGRSLRHFAQCTQHGLPANSVISRRDVNGQDREAKVGLRLGLQGVDERLRSYPRGEVYSGVGGRLPHAASRIVEPRCGRQVSPADRNQPTGSSRRLAKSNKSSQGNCSGDRRHLSSGEERRNIGKHKCRLFIIENEAEHFGRVAA